MVHPWRNQLTSDWSECLVASTSSGVRAVVLCVSSGRGAAESKARGVVHLWGRCLAAAAVAVAANTTEGVLRRWTGQRAARKDKRKKRMIQVYLTKRRSKRKFLWVENKLDVLKFTYWSSSVVKPCCHCGVFLTEDERWCVSSGLWCCGHAWGSKLEGWSGSCAQTARAEARGYTRPYPGLRQPQHAQPDAQHQLVYFRIASSFKVHLILQFVIQNVQQTLA